MDIYPQIQGLQLSKNFPDLSVSIEELEVAVVLRKNGVVVLSEEYTNGPLMSIIVKLKSLIHSLLEYTAPGTAEIEEITSSVANFGLKFGAEPEIVFTAIKAGVAIANYAEQASYANLFCNSRFLTWQPAIKQVSSFANQYLTYYCTVNTTLKYMVYPDAALYTLPMLAGKMYRLNIGALAYTETDVNRILVWAERAGGIKSNEQEYQQVTPRSESIDVFLFENSLGGIDTVEFTGSLIESDDHDIDRAVIGEETVEYSINYLREYKKYTGYIATEAERLWQRDFYTSLNRWHVVGGELKRIYVKGWDNESERNEINSGSFKFVYAQDDGTMLIS